MRFMYCGTKGCRGMLFMLSCSSTSHSQADVAAHSQGGSMIARHTSPSCQAIQKLDKCDNVGSINLLKDNKCCWRAQLRNGETCFGVYLGSRTALSYFTVDLANYSPSATLPVSIEIWGVPEGQTIAHFGTTFVVDKLDNLGEVVKIGEAGIPRNSWGKTVGISMDSRFELTRAEFSVVIAVLKGQPTNSCISLCAFRAFSL
jgi:hypothetical protein